MKFIRLGTSVWGDISMLTTALARLLIVQQVKNQMVMAAATVLEVSIRIKPVALLVNSVDPVNIKTKKEERLAKLVKLASILIVMDYMNASGVQEDMQCQALVVRRVLRVELEGEY